MIVNKKHRVLVLHLRDPSAVTNLIPHAKALHYKGHVLTVVPHRMTEYRLLKNLGLSPPHPVDYYYDWPGQYQPLDAQRSLYGAELELIGTRLADATNRVALYKALGGGWQ